MCFLRNDLADRTNPSGGVRFFWFIHITQLERNNVYIILIFQLGYIS